MALRAKTNRMLGEVATIVRLAKLDGRNPTDAVAIARQISKNHARQLIWRASNAGFALVPAQRRAATDE